MQMRKMFIVTISIKEIQIVRQNRYKKKQKTGEVQATCRKIQYANPESKNRETIHNQKAW